MMSRRAYVERLLARVVAPGGSLVVCSYGSSRPEGIPCEPLVDELVAWGLSVDAIEEARSPAGHVATRAVRIVA